MLSLIAASSAPLCGRRRGGSRRARGAGGSRSGGGNGRAPLLWSVRMSNETESKERLTTVNRTALLARDEPRRPAAHSESTLRVHLPTRARYSRCVHLPKRGVSEFKAKALAWSERRERVSSEWRECRDCRVERAAARADGVMARPEASESAARELRRQGRLSLQEREAPEQL